MSGRNIEPPNPLGRTRSTRSARSARSARSTRSARSVHSLRPNPAPNQRYRNSVSFDQSPEVPEKAKNALSPGSRLYKAKSNRHSLSSHKVLPVTPVGRAHGLPRSFVGGRKRIEGLLYGGKHCVMELYKMGPVELAHILARATPKDITRRLEYYLGMFPGSLNLDCSQNIAPMSPTQHKVYDNGNTAWIMSEEVLNQVLDGFRRCSKFTPEERHTHFSTMYKMQTWEYHAVSLNEDCPPFHRSHPGGRKPERIVFPYNVPIKSQVHPVFVFVSTTAKLLALKASNSRWVIPEEYNLLCNRMLYFWHHSFDRISSRKMQAFEALDYSDSEPDCPSELSHRTDSPCPSRSSTALASLPMSRSRSNDFSATLAASTSMGKRRIAADNAAHVAPRTRRRYTTQQASTSNACYVTKPINTPDNPFYDDMAEFPYN